jgi:hypothetical protein
VYLDLSGDQVRVSGLRVTAASGYPRQLVREVLSGLEDALQLSAGVRRVHRVTDGGRDSYLLLEHPAKVCRDHAKAGISSALSCFLADSGFDSAVKSGKLSVSQVDTVPAPYSVNPDTRTVYTFSGGGEC